MEVTTLYSYFTIVIEMFYNSQYIVRIVGGRNPAPNENKYVVSFQSKPNHFKIYGSGHFCGGVILNSKHILSAAHCFDQKEADDILAIIGIYNLYIENKSILHSNIKKIILHEKFDRVHHSNDIAIVHLEKRIHDYDNRIIPLQIQELTHPTRCHLLGWGQIYTNGPRIDVLYRVEFITREMSFCFINNQKKKKLMICVGSYNNSYACHGDSGGPLICNDHIAGILSHGWGCDPFAFVFTKVSYYEKWILRGSVNRNQSYNKFFLILITVLIKYI